MCELQTFDGDDRDGDGRDGRGQCVCVCVRARVKPIKNEHSLYGKTRDNGQGQRGTTK